MQSSVSKQFLLLNGKPVLLHSIETFLRAVPGIQITLVLSKNHEEHLHELRQQYNLPADITIVQGGKSRFASVKNALENIDGEGLLAIHDAARPLVSSDLILNAFSEAEKFRSAVPGIPVTDSLLYSEGKHTKSLRRENYFLLQSPQCFSLSMIRKAYEMEFHSHFTDDSSVWEAGGNKINLIQGDPGNIKITRAIDYKLVEMLVENKTR